MLAEYTFCIVPLVLRAVQYRFLCFQLFKCLHPFLLLLIRQNDLWRFKLTFFDKPFSKIDSFAFVLILDTLPALFQPIVDTFWWVNRDLLNAVWPNSARNGRYSLCCLLTWFLLACTSNRSAFQRTVGRKSCDSIYGFTSVGFASALQAVQTAPASCCNWLRGWNHSFDSRYFVTFSSIDRNANMVLRVIW